MTSFAGSGEFGFSPRIRDRMSIEAERNPKPAALTPEQQAQEKNRVMWADFEARWKQKEIDAEQERQRTRERIAARGAEQKRLEQEALNERIVAASVAHLSPSEKELTYCRRMVAATNGKWNSETALYALERLRALVEL